MAYKVFCVRWWHAEEFYVVHSTNKLFDAVLLWWCHFPPIRNEKSAQKGNFRPDVPADIPPKTSVTPSKSGKNKHLGTDNPRGRPRKNFGLIFRSLSLRSDWQHPSSPVGSQKKHQKRQSRHQNETQIETSNLLPPCASPLLRHIDIDVTLLSVRKL